MKHRYSRGSGLVVSALLGLLDLIPYRVGVVAGRSMVPTLQSGQVIVIERRYYRTHRPRSGEIVVFRHADLTYVKRVYAVGGETIFLLADAERPAGQSAFIRPVRAAQVERVRALLPRRSALYVHSLHIPPDSFFALGDAVNNSIDSRALGPIADDELIGRVQTLAVAPPAPEPEVALPPVRRATATAQKLRRQT